MQCPSAFLRVVDLVRFRKERLNRDVLATYVVWVIAQVVCECLDVTSSCSYGNYLWKTSIEQCPQIVANALTNSGYKGNSLSLNATFFLPYELSN